MFIYSSTIQSKKINLNLIFMLAFSTVFCSIFHKPKILKVLIGFILIVGISSCTKDKYIIGSGSNTTTLRSESNFTSINLRVNAEVQIIQDSIYKIEIKAQKNIADVLETNVTNNVLQIRLKSFTSINKHNPIIIIVHVPSVSQLDVSGSGSIICENAFSAENLNLCISGSGSILFNGNISNYITTNVSGSGKIIVLGTSFCKSAEHVVSGSGIIDVLDVDTENAEIVISGSGKIKVNISKSLSGNISGSGIIEYKGNAVSSVSVTGSGKVLHIN